MVRDLDFSNSTLGYIMTFKGNNILIIEIAKCIALQVTEVKCTSATEASKEILWMKNLLKQLGLKKNIYFTVIVKVPFIWRRILLTIFGPSMLMCDITGPKMCKSDLMQLEKIYIDNNGSEMMTKFLPTVKLEAFWMKARLVELPPSGIQTPIKNNYGNLKVTSEDVWLYWKM